LFSSRATTASPIVANIRCAIVSPMARAIFSSAARSSADAEPPFLVRRAISVTSARSPGLITRSSRSSFSSRASSSGENSFVAMVGLLSNRGAQIPESLEPITFEAQLEARRTREC
jgi:hypothetical protein